MDSHRVTDLLDGLIQPAAYLRGDPDPPPPRQPPGWRIHNIIWRTPRIRAPHIEQEDLAMLAALSRAGTLPVELLPTLTDSRAPLRAMQQHAHRLARQGLVITGTTRNTSGKPRLKLLATSPAARRAMAEIHLANGRPATPRHVPAFTIPRDPSGAQTARHLQNATAIADLIRRAGHLVDDWHLIHPSTRSTTPALIGGLSLAGDLDDAHILRLDQPYHQRRRIERIPQFFIGPRRAAAPPIVLVLTPTLRIARDAAAIADRVLTMPGTSAQPARERTIFVAINQVGAQRILCHRVNPDPPEARDPAAPPRQTYALFPQRLATK
jgi:hypothetical protein